MKRLVLVAAIIGLSACAESETDAPAAEETVEPAAVLAADGQPPAGSYRITLADGTVFMEELDADGTYTQTDESGEVVETGSWDQKSPEQFCFTVDAEYVDEDTPAEEQCNSEAIGEDGVWTSTGADGEAVTVERVEG